MPIQTPLTTPSPILSAGNCKLVFEVCESCKFLCIISFYIPHVRDIIKYFSFSVWLPSLSMTRSGSIRVAANGITSFFSIDWVIFHCICAPHLLYPFLCRWTLKLLPRLACCKKCCNEHCGARVFLDHVFLWIYAQEWIAGSYDSSVFSF